MLRLAKKFSSSTGASILLALAVVLVCSMVAAIVLVAAAANAGKGVASQDQTRAFYAVSSAAQLLADDMKANDLSANVTASVKSYDCQKQHPSYVHDDANVALEPELIFTLVDTTPLSLTIEEALYAVGPMGSTSSYERTFTIEAPNLPDVDAHFVMDDEYNITIELSSTPAVGGYGYAMTLVFPCVKGEPQTTTDIAADDVHMDGWEWEEGGDEYSWLEENIPPIDPSTGNHNPESNEYGHSVAQTYNVVTTTTSTQLSWGDATISKGIAE